MSLRCCSESYRPRCPSLGGDGLGGREPRNGRLPLRPIGPGHERNGPQRGVCDERAVCVQRCGTVREMKEGPSRPAVRCRSQATASCCRQERWWPALRKRRDMIPAGKVERGERKRTVDEVSKAD